MLLKERVIQFTAKAAGIGDMPFAPGTFGSLAALPLCYLFSRLDLFLWILLLVVLVVLSIWIAGAAEKLIKKKDPSCIVIDEIAGMAVALAGLPFNGLIVGAGFICFRILDITKPVPIRSLEKRLAGGTGIVADDVVAGIFTNILLRGLLFFIA